MGVINHRKLLSIALIASLACAGLASCGGGGSGSPSQSASVPVSQDNPPPIRHVFTIVLENKGFQQTFGPNSKAPFLAQELTQRGQLLRRYYGIGHLSLDNYIAMVSGQAPNLQTQADCKIYSDFLTLPGLVLNGQVIGTGCVYPASVKTVVDQLEDAGFTWKGYMEDMGNVAPSNSTCRHPALNQLDRTQSARPDDQYTARHNPFVYFHSIIDDRPRCDAHDVPLSELPDDLLNTATTPNYVFITPNLCNDAHDAPCANGDPGGLVSADLFLREWVPRIMASPAYQQDGMIVITFDEAEAEGGSADASACCNEQAGPNSPLPGILGAGGGRTGTLLISPFIEPGSVNDTGYNHYSFLRSVENLFGLDYLGYAGQPGLRAFGADVYNHPQP